jgi:hypothetical protein
MLAGCEATAAAWWPQVGAGLRHARERSFQVAGGSPGWQVAGRVALKGKPETGINASVICSHHTIRSPYGAPFEFYLFCLEVGTRPP